MLARHRTNSQVGSMTGLRITFRTYMEAFKNSKLFLGHISPACERADLDHSNAVPKVDFDIYVRGTVWSS